MTTAAKTASLLRTAHSPLATWDVLFDHLPAGVCVCDAQGVIQRYNRCAAELWGREPKLGDTKERFCGAYRLYRPDGTLLPHVSGPVALALQTGQPQHEHVIFKRPDGSRLSALVNVELIRDATGAVVGSVHVLQETAGWNFDAPMEQARLAVLTAEINQALVRGAGLREMLQDCAEALVRHLDAAFARVWTLDAAVNVLILRASAGLYTHLDGPHSRVPVGQYKIGLIALNQQAHLTNDVAGNPHVSDQEWARREGMVAFAGYPLLVDGELVGVMALFARQPLSAATLRAMAAVANGIALGIRRKQAEVAQRESEGLFRNAFEHAAGGMFLVGLDGQWLRVNKALCEIVGYTEQEMLATTFQALTHPDDLDADLALARRLLSGEIPFYHLEKRYIHKAGQPVWVLLSASVVRDATGQPLYCVGHVRDITPKRRLEEELVRDAFLLASVQDSVIVTDLEGIVTYWNEGATRLFGWTAHEMLGKRYIDRFPDPEARATIDTNIRAMAQGAEWCGEWEDYRKDGSRVWIDLRVRRISDKDGKPVGILGVAHDITLRKEAERRLAETSQDREQTLALLDTLLTHAPVGFGFVDRAFRFVRCNDALAEIDGVSRADHLGRTVQEVLPGMWPTLEPIYCQVLEGGRPIAGLEISGETPAAPGQTRYWIVSYYPVLVQGEVAGVGVIIIETTERRRLEEQFRHAQKMDAFGQLAGGIAHDFNNLMTVVNGFAEIVLGDMAPEHPQRGLLQEIKRAGERATSLTQQLLAFSRKQMLQMKVLDLNGVIRDMEKMLRRTLGEDVELIAALTPDLGRVKVDPGQISQVILNVVVNARDAMPCGGRLSIETHNAHLDVDHARKDRDVEPGPYVLLVIRDSGSGMDDATKARIFEPFFTTKEVGHGSGLGLATVYGIIKQSGGHIEVESLIGAGTTFKIYLPRVVDVRSRDSHPGLLAAPLGSETVLLVEDEDAVRGFTGLALQSSGYTVLTAKDGEDALRVATGHSGPVHLLVTDVVMPRMGGRVLAERLRALYPEAKVLFVSGYSDDAVIRHGVLGATANLLHKPFSPAALAKKVREVLDSSVP